MGDAEAIEALDGVIAQRSQFEEEAGAYVGSVTSLDSATLSQLARELMPKLWPGVLTMIGQMEQLATDQQAKLAAERAAADKAADTTLMLLIALSVLASLAGVASLAALSLSGLSEKVDEYGKDYLVTTVKEAAAAISRDLGFGIQRT